MIIMSLFREFLVDVYEFFRMWKSFPSLQEKVACLDDNDARLAVDPRNKYRIQVQLLIFVINHYIFSVDRFEKLCIRSP